MDNILFSPRSVYHTFKKAGHLIILLGWVSFFGKLIIELLVFLHCYLIQFDLKYQRMSGEDQQTSGYVDQEDELYHWTRNVYHLPFVQENQFLILMVAKELGNIMFSTWINAFSCVYPGVPFLLQMINVILWAINLKYQFVVNLWVTFVWMTIVGGIYGTSMTNFIFLANAKTDLYSDLNLKYNQRELVVNALIIANYMGQFFALVVTIGCLETRVPSAIFNPPS